MGERAVEDAHVQAQKLRDDAAAKGRAVPEVEAKRLLEAADAKAAALRDDADARAARLVQKAEQKKAELSDDASGVIAVKDFLDNVAKVAARPLMQVLPVPGAARVQALLAVGR